jgi:ubiquitin-protein ligase E3 C
LNDLAAVLNLGTLSSALVHEYGSSSVSQLLSERRLWLLAHFISLHRLQRRSGQEPEYLRALSLQLSGSSTEIVGRIDAADPETLHEATEIGDAGKALPPLPTFVKDELLSLVNQESISGLLAKFNIDYAKASASGEEDASLLASYALTLLRIFPRRGDEIRMWLYGGSMTASTGAEIPALKFFWQAMRLTSTFSVISADSKAALTLLRPQIRNPRGSVSSSDVREIENGGPYYFSSNFTLSSSD